MPLRGGEGLLAVAQSTRGDFNRKMNDGRNEDDNLKR